MKIGVLQQVGSNLYIWVEKFLEVKNHSADKNNAEVKSLFPLWKTGKEKWQLLLQKWVIAAFSVLLSRNKCYTKWSKQQAAWKRQDF